MHVRGLVLDRLERADRHPELMSAANMLEGQIQDALAGTDHGDGHAGQGNMARPLTINEHPVTVGHPDLVKRQVGHVEHRIEHRFAPRRKQTGVNDEDPGLGHHRYPVYPIAIENVAGGAVQDPTIGIPPRGDSAVHGGAGLIRVEPLADQRGKLAQRCQERSGVGGAA
jgi:hypothetical protein